jgi:hypothetical protein
MVPDISRMQWKVLISSNEKVNNLALQMKLNSLRLDFKLKRIDVDSAVQELFFFCQKNEKMLEAEIKRIFGL